MSEYNIRKLPHPGQSIPNRAFVGHTGSGPPGVVGSPAQMAAHINVVDAATANGAPNLSETDPWRVTISAIRI
jgi:hypothetical protein